MTNLKWREQPVLDPKQCKTKCCKTALGVCYTKYSCRCHVPLDVNR